MTRPSMQRSHLLIPLVLAALTACQDSPPTSIAGPREIPGPRFGAFAGNNGKIAFASNRLDGGIMVMNSDGSNAQSLSDDGSGPAWSADGTKIAFASNLFDDNLEIYIMDGDGAGRTRLTNNTSTDAAPAWSPDGSRIVFHSDRDGNSEIYAMNADGSDPVRLTNNGAGDFGPSWSPDGTKIAFTSIRDGNLEIYVMAADGSNPTRLTNDLARDFDPGWSPDGSQIVFSHGGEGDSDIYIMNADGSSPTNLTQTSESAEVTAAWSPDGGSIAFVSDRDGNAEIYVMNADGSNPTNVSNHSASEELPDWQPLPVAPAVCVFGPTIYTRGKGAPIRATQMVTATPGSYIVDLDDLGSSGADAIVKLNGVVIMDGRGTTGEVGPRHYTVPVTLTANNVLELDVRGKKESVLQVKICPAPAEACYPNLPAPVLELELASVDGSFARFELNVPNYAEFPDALFTPAPDLPECGLNTSASRTWIDIYDGQDNLLFGFCGFSSASDMNTIYFATPLAQYPAEAYIVVDDRRCNRKYTSNRINLAGIL